jgi:sugar lactone lactonase YvrE
VSRRTPSSRCAAGSIAAWTRSSRSGRLTDSNTVADLAAAFTATDPIDMVMASDGSLWVAEVGRGRVIRVDPATGEAAVLYRAGQDLGGVTAGAPWMIATAATDVVLLDRDRQAWRFDLVEQVAHPLGLPGLGPYRARAGS